MPPSDALSCVASAGYRLQSVRWLMDNHINTHSRVRVALATDKPLDRPHEG